MRADKIYLVGFMGAGKSSVARALAARLDWQAADIDERVEAREHLRVSEIFAMHGEPHFRAAERAVLADLLPIRSMVVATGSGTFVDPESRLAMMADGATIWLDAPLADLLPRIPRDGSRPLAVDRPQLERLFESRRLAYRHAHVRIDASRKSIGDLVEVIVDWLGA